MNNFIEWISSVSISHWSNLSVIAGVVGGALVMWRNILTIRKLQTELRDIREKKQTESTRIKVATDVEIEKYGRDLEYREWRAPMKKYGFSLHWLSIGLKWIIPLMVIVLMVYYATLPFKLIAVVSVGLYFIITTLKRNSTLRNANEHIELQRYRHISASLAQKGITKQIQPTPKGGAADL
jgi:hypothetical protein